MKSQQFRAPHGDGVWSSEGGEGLNGHCGPHRHVAGLQRRRRGEACLGPSPGPLRMSGGAWRGNQHRRLSQAMRGKKRGGRGCLEWEERCVQLRTKGHLAGSVSAKSSRGGAVCP